LEQTIFNAADKELPLILHERAFAGTVTNPCSGFVNYVNHLYEAGFGPDTINPDYADLYLLDYHNAQVHNGGHSQFVSNSREHLFENITRAIRAAHMIGLPSLAGIIEQCETWCRNNPDEAAQQTGFDVRASELDALDTALYRLQFSDDELLEYLNSLPDELNKDLRHRLFVPRNAEELTEHFVAETLVLARTKTPEEAAKDALPILDPLVAWKSVNTFESFAKGQCDLIVSYLNRFDGEEQELAKELRKRVTSDLASPDRNDRSQYNLKVLGWLATHPNLDLVPSDSWSARIDEIVTSSPFAGKERNARDMDKLHALTPTDSQMALALLLGQVLKDKKGHGRRNFIFSDPENSPTRELHLLEVGESRFFVEKLDNSTRLRKVKQNWARKIYLASLYQLAKLRLVDGSKYLSALTEGSDHKPGRIIAETEINAVASGLFKTLFIPEALGVAWPADDARSSQSRNAIFQRGLILEMDSAAPRLTWHVDAPDGPVTFEANADGVLVVADGVLVVKETTYSRQHLVEYRESRSR